MLALVVSVVTRLVAYVARPIIGLRYRIDLRGLDAVKRKGRRGILFLPNHSSLLDPALHRGALSTRRSSCARSPTSTRSTGRCSATSPCSTGRASCPTWSAAERAPATARAPRCRRSPDGLKAGENILLYPAGRLKRAVPRRHRKRERRRDAREGGPGRPHRPRAAQRTLGQQFQPRLRRRDARHRQRTGSRRRVPPANGIFFMPRRRMSVELVEPADFPRTGTRAEINRYLERFYNEHAARNTYVPYGFWEKGGTREMPEPVREAPRSDASHVAPATRDLVLAHLRDESGRAEVSIDNQLSKDLGFDSLATAELVTWLQQEFGFSVDTPESLTTVADVVLAAAGQGVSHAASDLKAPPASWFAASGRPDGPGAAAGRHADLRVPEAGRRPAPPTDLRRPVERHAHLSRPGHRRARAQAEARTAAGPVCRHHDARIGGRHRVPARRALRREDAGHGELDRGNARAAALARHARRRDRRHRPGTGREAGLLGRRPVGHRRHLPVRGRRAGVGEAGREDPRRR